MSDYLKANEYVKSNNGTGVERDVWDQSGLRLIGNWNVASKLFDMADMFGVCDAIKMLQNVLNEPLEEHDEHFTVNGILTQRMADAVSLELKYPGGEFALLAALVGACEDKLNDLPDTLERAAKLKRAEKLP